MLEFKRWRAASPTPSRDFTLRVYEQPVGAAVCECCGSMFCGEQVVFMNEHNQGIMYYIGTGGDNIKDKIPYQFFDITVLDIEGDPLIIKQRRVS